MKLVVRRVNTRPEDPGSDALTGPIVLYGIDGDGVLYFHKYNPDGKRTGGGAYADGRWSYVEEAEPAESQLVERWRKMQSAVTEDPSAPPKW